MEAQVIYDSNHGKSKIIAHKFDYEVSHVNNAKLWADLIIFICPTYGDEELPADMEKFLINLKLTNKLYVICELGNYYGYEEFEFGAKKIIENCLKTLLWKEFFPSLSLDSLPIIDWNTFYTWKGKLEHVI